MKYICKKTDREFSYLDLLNSIDAERITLSQQALGELGTIDKRYVAIRHDVDHDMLLALQFAEVEQEHGIKATYFLLHSEGYFQNTKRFPGHVQRMSKMGHEIALHNNALTPWFLEQQHPLGTLQKALQTLRDNTNRVVGTSSHGDPHCYTYNPDRVLRFVNYQMWYELPKRFSPRPKDIPVISMTDLGLVYEAYFLNRDAYITDSGGVWAGGVKDEIEPFESYDKQGNDRLDHIISEFNKLDKGVLQLLVHPFWWTVT